MKIEETKAYKIYSEYVLRNEKLKEQYQHKKISREEFNRIGKESDLELLAEFKKVPEVEKKISFKSIVLKYKEQEDLKINE